MQCNAMPLAALIPSGFAQLPCGQSRVELRAVHLGWGGGEGGSVDSILGNSTGCQWRRIVGKTLGRKYTFFAQSVEKMLI